MTERDHLLAALRERGVRPELLAELSAGATVDQVRMLCGGTEADIAALNRIHEAHAAAEPA